MKISFITCVWDRVGFEKWVLPVARKLGVEMIEVASDRSIYEAYNRGTVLATGDVLVYLHDDTEILDPDRFAHAIAVTFSDPTVGLAGPIGCRTLKMLPWWIPSNGKPVGAVWHGRNNKKAWFGKPVSGKNDVDVLDGLLMATTERIWWPEEDLMGFHMYDMHLSFEIRRRGKRVVVMPMGGIHHHCDSKGKRNMAWHVAIGQKFADMNGIEFSNEDFETAIAGGVHKREAQKMIDDARESLQS